MTNYNKAEIRDIVFGALNEGVDDKDVRTTISEITGLKKTARNELFNLLKKEWENTDATYEVVVEVPGTQSEQEVKKAITLAIGDRYTYNGESDQYVVWLKAANKNVVIPGSLHRDMLKAYSNWTGDAATINEICRNFSIPRKWFEEYKTIMGWSHDHEPISNEELLSKDENSVVDDLLQQKRFSLHQKFQKKDWEATQRDAEKWRSFQVGQIDPFESFLKTWENKTHNLIAPYTDTFKGITGNTVLVVGLSDIHAGGFAESKSLYRGEDWNISNYRKAVRAYIAQLQFKVANMVNKPSKVVVLGVGDILHGLKGTTEKGTPLVFDRLKDTQFDAAFESLTEFISAMGSLAPQVEVHSVRGNHDGVSGYILFKALEAYFRTDTRISFNVPSTETHALRVLDTLVIISHGASADYKAKVPRKGTARDSYVQSLLLAKPELLCGVKQKLFICGDLHSFEHEEKNDFEYFRFSTMVPGDAYADGLNLHSRPRQNALLIGLDGVEQVIHCYL